MEYINGTMVMAIFVCRLNGSNNNVREES